MMLQPQISSAPSLLRRDTIFPCHDLGPFNPCSAHTKTMSQLHFPCRDLPCCHPCRDFKVMSRPGAKKNRSRAQRLIRGRAGVVMRATAPALCTYCLLVTTSTVGRDLVLEIGSSHSSFCLAQKKNFAFFFFQSPPVAFHATPPHAVT